MLYSKERNAVFVRVPKTGSTSVHHGHVHYHGPWTAGDRDTHTLPSHNTVEKKTLFKDARWFSAIRHPIPWLDSFYKWLCQNNVDDDKYVFGSGLPSNGQEYLDRLKWTPCDWAYDADGIVEIETYKLEEPALAEEILGFKLAHHNSTGSPKRFNWSDKQLAQIERVFHRELKHYQSGDIELWMQRRTNSK